MSKQWQIRRGTTAENDAFTGAVGELTMDTDKKQIRLHDGVTEGGYIFGDTVIEWQLPTADNNYTWYRKYRSGWVEQGCNNPGTFGTVTLPITMADSFYNITITPSDTYYVPRVTARSNASFSSNGRNIDNSKLSGETSFVSWQVSGMAA